MRRNALFPRLFNLVVATTAVVVPAVATAQEIPLSDDGYGDDDVLDREFMIGPRLIFGGQLWSRAPTDPDEGEPLLLGLELDMRKELGIWALRANIGFHLRADFSDGEVFLADIGSDFYIINAPTSPYAGVYVGLRISEGPNTEHTALAIGPVVGGRVGVMFMRHRSTRFYIEGQAGFAVMSYLDGVLEDVTPPSFNAVELLVSAGVGF